MLKTTKWDAFNFYAPFQVGYDVDKHLVGQIKTVTLGTYMGNGHFAITKEQAHEGSKSAQ
jgi:hypothetical protein